MGENAPFTYHKKEGGLLPIFAPFRKKSRNIFQRGADEPGCTRFRDALRSGNGGHVHFPGVEHPEAAVLRSGQAALDLLNQGSGPLGLFRAGLGSIQCGQNIFLNGWDRPQLVHMGVQRDAVVIEPAPVLFGIIVVTVRPDLPAERFLLAGKVLAGQPDMYAGDAPAYDSVLVKLVQSKIALGIKHNFLHFICRGLRTQN